MKIVKMNFVQPSKLRNLIHFFRMAKVFNESVIIAILLYLQLNILPDYSFSTDYH